MPSTHTTRGWRILRFLRRKPTPAKVLGENLDGDEVRVAVTGDTAAALADAVTALSDCWTIKAVDKDGALIRKLEMDPRDPELAGENPEDDKPARAGSIISVDVPKLVDNIARNMREVASSSASQQANAFKEGFAAMTSVVNLCLEMLMRVDQRLEHAEIQAAVNTTGEEQQSTNQQLAMMAIQKALGAPGQPSPSNGSNGNGVPPQMLKALIEQLTTPGDDNGTG
jgi:hypothetical protein